MARDYTFDYSNNDTWWQHGRTFMMAQIHVQPPDLFDFKSPDDWPHCRDAGIMPE